MKSKIITGPITVELTLSHREAVILNTLLSLTASCIGDEGTVGHTMFEMAQALERCGIEFKSLDWVDEDVEAVEVATRPLCKLTGAEFDELEDA